MRLLIIGSLKGHATSAAKMAMNQGAKVIHVFNLEDALEGLRAGKGADLALIDLDLPISSFVQSLKQERISLPIVSCGVDGDPDQAARSIHDGALDYLPLPPDHELISALLAAVARVEKEFIYADPKMAEIIRISERMALSEANVLLTGESGTGKEVLARFLHQKSKRATKPFISINCAAIPENLLESELFGHEKGAFTGAISRRIGKFEEANEGTLLLDEISEMDLRLQAKLLRAIQERVIDRVGGQHPIKINIRILATSNRNLWDTVKAGIFREDLYFRLNVLNLHIPPLRERPDDIVPLAQFFIQKYCAINHLPLKNFSKETLDAIRKAPWTGNVRELENHMHRAVVLSEDSILNIKDVLDTETQSTSTTHSLVGKKLCDIEKEIILGTLDRCLGNRTHAANILGISIRTLRNKLKEYRIASEIAV